MGLFGTDIGDPDSSSVLGQITSADPFTSFVAGNNQVGTGKSPFQGWQNSIQNSTEQFDKFTHFNTSDPTFSKLDPNLGIKIPSGDKMWDDLTQDIAHPNQHSVWGQLTGNWRFGSGGSSDPNAPPPPPTQADANQFALGQQLSQEQKMYASRTILGTEGGLLDQQPQVASRVLLGS